MNRSMQALLLCASNACGRAAAATNCSCGAHGSPGLPSATSGVSSCCVCDNGWTTDPTQDLFSMQYCNIQQSTLASMANPNVSGDTVPASALSTQSSGGMLKLTPSGWALIVGIILVLVLLTYCCYRRGCYRKCMRSTPSSGSAQARRVRVSRGHESPMRSRLRRLSSSSLHALRRMMLMRQLHEEDELTRKNSPNVHPLTSTERAQRRRRARQDDGEWSDADIEEAPPHPRSRPPRPSPRAAAPSTAAQSPGAMPVPQMLPPPHFMMPSPLPGPVEPVHATPFPAGLNVYSNAAYAEHGSAQQMQVQQQQLIALATAFINHQSAMNPPPAGPDAARLSINRAVADWPQFSPPAPSRARTPRSSGQSPGSHSKGKTRRQALRSLVRELDAVSAEASDMEEGEVQRMRHADGAGHGEGSVDEDEDDALQEARAAEGRLHAQRR